MPVDEPFASPEQPTPNWLPEGATLPPLCFLLSLQPLLRFTRMTALGATRTRHLRGLKRTPLAHLSPFIQTTLAGLDGNLPITGMRTFNDRPMKHRSLRVVSSVGDEVRPFASTMAWFLLTIKVPCVE